MTALEYAILALQAIGTLMRAGQQVYDLLAATERTLTACKAESRDPSAEEWAALNAVIDRLRAGLHRPSELEPAPAPAGEPSPTEGGGLTG